MVRKEKVNEGKGITLVALVITIIVLLILAGVGLYYIFREEGVLDQARKAKFVTEYTEIDEKVQLYQNEKVIEEIVNGKTGISLPLKSKLTSSEIKMIEINYPTLAMTIKAVNGTNGIGQANLYWIDKGLIKAKEEHEYIIDIDTMKIYDYEGQYFFRRMWHIPEIGLDTNNIYEIIGAEENTWDGWITLDLYYPNNATEKMWRLSEEGETRYDDNLVWEEYKGSITVRISQVDNIWIKYKLNGKTVIIPPNGQLLVDIEVSPTGGQQEEVTVKINFAEDAETKEYRVNGEFWQDYEGEFKIAENVLIEAKGTKREYIYNQEGQLLTTQLITGRDSYFIRNIKTNKVDTSLETPRITYTNNESGKKVVTVTYPDSINSSEGSTGNIVKKYISINHGPKQEYLGPVEVKEGDTVTAWYETSSGTVSKYVSANTGNGSQEDVKEYVPYEYGATNIPQSADSIEGPTISINCTGKQATITLTTNKAARKKYIKLGNGAYQEYTGPIVVNSNMIVSAYYITSDDGTKSKTSYGRVTGISTNGKPVVTINADPYPYGNSKIVDKVTVTIVTNVSASQYSYDGIVYTEYTTPIEITKNCRIYAKATNENGTTVEYLDITNLSNNSAVKQENLDVSIMVDPEPILSTEKEEKVTVSISYDKKATKKYYTIGKEGELQEYTEPFEIRKNCTIYAYAISDKGSGQTSKIIDNLYDGIANPIIQADPNNLQTSTSTKISIKYDSNAKTKKYEINGGGLVDYTGEFEVTQNCTIRAVNNSTAGESAESTYQVTNIISSPAIVILDKGDYYLIKLPFPNTAKDKEYKYKENGEWKKYPTDGILLIKPEKKNSIVKDDKIIVKVENETGSKVEFKGDWYLLDCPINETPQNFFMRWDRIQSEKPTIIPSITEPAKEVRVTIVYPNTIIKKLYKIVNPDGTQGNWQEYKDAIVINKKGTVIYAKGIDEAGVYSKEATMQINNIDRESPKIKLTADVEKLQQKVVVKVSVTDDTRVDIIKWAKGNLGESQFTSTGTTIPNNSTITLTENGVYTFYAQDSVGNTQIYTLTIGNIDLDAPNINITSSPNTIGTQAQITIDYGDAVTKQYKIGNVASWKNYTGEIALTSYDVINAKVVNSDYTVTIYARGVDSAGNETIVDEKLYNLDLDIPSTPVIKTKTGYPIIRSTGIGFDDDVEISYDRRKGLKHYYSTDGKTWIEYTGPFKLKSGTIYAKSVRVATGLEKSTSKTITVPGNAVGPLAYNGNWSDYESKNGSTRILVDESMWGKKFKVKFRCYREPCAIRYYTSSGSFLKEVYNYPGSTSSSGDLTKTYTIEKNTGYIEFYFSYYRGSICYFYIYEIQAPV